MWLELADVNASRDSEDESEYEEPQALRTLQPPGRVKVVPILLADIEVLWMLTAAEDPPLLRVRAQSKVNILYCHGDASGSGFGWCIYFGDGVRYELGEWCETIQEATSNYRELMNLVNDMVHVAQEGRLDGCEVFLYTDKQTAEGAYIKGTTKSRALFELIVMLYQLQMEFDFILHVIWIAGTRMIQQGNDGLSRGEENGLATGGLSLGGTVPLHLSATERIPKLGGWIQGWWDNGRKLLMTEPRDWFTTAHTPGNFGWCPAPATADAAINQCCEALHKMPYCYHVFAMSLIMTNIWRKTVLKAVDVYFMLKPVCAIWDHSQHEPLGIFIYLPLSRTPNPWWTWRAPCKKCQTMISYRNGIFCANFFAWRGNWKPRQKAWCGDCYTPLKGGRFPVRLPKDEEGNLLVNEQDKLRLAVARPGDHLFCHFRNIQGRSPKMGLGPLDNTEQMKSLRWINLDAFLSREPTTVSQNLGKINRALQIAHEMGMSNPPVPKLGPWKLEDEFGAGEAAIMARHSMDPGITEDMVQYETVQKMKSVFVNLYQASVENASMVVIGGKDEKKQLVMGVPIYHYWHDRAHTGMYHRMGDKVVQDYGLSRKAAITLQGLLEEEWAEAQHDAVKRLDIVQLVSFVFLGYARYLRGEDIIKIELGEVRKYFADGALEPKHVTLSLIGRFKQFEGGQQKILPVAGLTGSGIRVREWVEILLLEKAEVGLTSGFIFLKNYRTPALCTLLQLSKS
jgi:hypothetical protein